MAAAFALGAEAVQMGTRMVSAAESPVHHNWKDAIINAKETDTLFLNRHGPGPALRALRTERTTKLDVEPTDNIMGEMRGVLDLYFGGDMEAAIALSGQVAGRIDAVKPAKQIIDEVMEDFYTVMNDLRRDYL
jgi:enoyl-[acyl-carrier protein] reductase II